MPDLNAMQRYQVAGQLFKNKRYAEALRLLDQLVNEVPGNTDIMHARAMCLAGARRVEEALQVADTLANIYGDPRGAQLRALLTVPKVVPQNVPAAKGAKAAPAARKPGAKRSPRMLVLLVLVAAALGGGAYYYFGGQSTSGASGTAATATSSLSAPKAFTTGFVGDPNGEKISVVNETGGELDLWLGDAGAIMPPLVRLDTNGAATVGVPRGKAKLRARADWGTLHYVTANTDIDVSGPGTLVFYRETNAVGVSEVKWRQE